MVWIVMPKHILWNAAVSDALDHGCMIPSVRVDFTSCGKETKPKVMPHLSSSHESGRMEVFARFRLILHLLYCLVTWHHAGEREESGVIGHKTGGKEQSGIFVMQAGQFLLQSHVESASAGNVPGTSSSCSVTLQSIPEG